jgi:hypothetical protein
VAFPVIVGRTTGRSCPWTAWFLDDEVFEDQQLVVIDEPTWLES